MKSLSQSEYGELRSLYQQVYVSPEVEITEELIDEIFDELVEELVEEGYAEEEAYSLVEEATDTYIDEAKVTFGHDTQATRKSGAPVGARRRYGMRKAGAAVKAAKDAVDTAKKKAAGAAAGAAIAGSIAKDEVRRAGRKAAHSASKAASAVKSAPGKAKEKAKSGIKGFIKRQAEKVVNRMSEEAIQEDSRRMSNKQKTASVRQNIKAFGSNFTPPNNYDPDANRGKGEVLTRKQIEKKRRKSLRQEELEATALFTTKEIEAIMEAEMSEGYDEPKMHAAAKRVMQTQGRPKGMAASALHSKYSMRSKGNIAGETDGPGPNAPKRSGRKGRGSETDRGSGNAAKRRMEG